MKRQLFSMAVAIFASATASAETVTISVRGAMADSIKSVNMIVNDNRKSPQPIEVTNGQFAYSGQTEANDIVIFNIGDYELAVVADQTPVTLNFNDMTIKGSEVNNAFGEFQTSQHAYDRQILALYKQYKEKSRMGEAAKEDIRRIIASYDSIENISTAKIMEYIPAHKNDVTPAYFIRSIMSGLDYEQLEKVLITDAAFYNHPMTAKAKESLQRLARRRPGVMFSELEMSDPTGATHKLSEWVGKGNYVLVDFWASWCGPCRQEMPNVVEAYRRYHDRGFDVVAVSFDQDATAWKNAIEKLGMAWHNISDLKGWQCAASEIYGINSIPSNILVGPDGKIVASDLRGESLLKKLAEIYK